MTTRTVYSHVRYKRIVTGWEDVIFYLHECSLVVTALSTLNDVKDALCTEKPKY